MESEPYRLWNHMRGRTLIEVLYLRDDRALELLLHGWSELDQKNGTYIKPAGWGISDLLQEGKK